MQSHEKLLLSDEHRVNRRDYLKLLAAILAACASIPLPPSPAPNPEQLGVSARKSKSKDVPDDRLREEEDLERWLNFIIIDQGPRNKRN